MTDAAIVAATGTPIGTAFKGSLVDVDAFELGTLVVREAVDRAGIDPGLLDDVALGETLYGTGVAAMCAGGGMSTAVVLDVLSA
jgi:acetyl-CoA C-acetyltransferase